MTESMERLQKVIAQSGITSRRKAEQLIVAGKVKVNNKIVTELGTKVSLQDKIEVNGVNLEKEMPVYFMLYKPRGVISSVTDDKGRKVVTDFFTETPERLFPIGRLDYDSTGLILLTNDGEFANLLMHPRHEIEKVYTVKVKGIVQKTDLSQLRKGVKEGRDLLRAVRSKIISFDKRSNSTVLEIVLNEGKNRHIRRMMQTIGYPVTKLKRESYGLLTLRGLRVGEFRALTPKEVKQMWNLATKNVKQ
ncbi:pseudouridine synthase [Virgibacillus soli]|uniref:Pseudouridine synthase n=1 Tax=Paracerasibacillus soli TaxID=480284 RepID=A0ABU5CRA8_9BACI|nr:pseudouridine synthase [Virgibacillus soli]MDY0408344.1 pseudouridine synthase [Virgibacillus soli]